MTFRLDDKVALVFGAGSCGPGWDVAHAAVFLASDEAKYINGVLLPVDGGLSCAGG